MEVRLVRALEADATSIFDIQVRAFAPLLEKYQDYDTNPGNETIDRVIWRINDPNGAFYKIVEGHVTVGAIRIRWHDEPTQLWISPLFIAPEHQGRGYAQQAIALAEQAYPDAVCWELATLLEEERNCRLYEKMGYVRTGELSKLNERATLVFYRKIL
ncbi:MAG: GNAT family N-acetyltransferase [Cohnella sp.]|nr:GNAT family N-acetyltransferase [Cohnella sp.]